MSENFLKISAMDLSCTMIVAERAIAGKSKAQTNEMKEAQILNRLRAKAEKTERRENKN